MDAFWSLSNSSVEPLLLRKGPHLLFRGLVVVYIVIASFLNILLCHDNCHKDHKPSLLLILARNSVWPWIILIALSWIYSLSLSK